MIYRFLFFLVFVAILSLTIAYSRGYRIDILQNEITSNGLVAVTSNPKGAKIFINGKLEGVTDTTVYLNPDTHTFTVMKDGYFPWKKTVSVNGEIVHSVDATLYPINSSLNPLTNIGVKRSIRFGIGEQKALIFSKKSVEDTSIPTLTDEPSSTQEKKDGLFVFDPNVRAVTLFSSLSSLAEYSVFPVEIDPAKIAVVFSPNYDQIILFNLSDDEAKAWDEDTKKSTELAPFIPYPTKYTSAFLLSLSEYNPSPLDVTTSATVLIDAWMQKKTNNLEALVSSYKKDLKTFLLENTELVDISQDKNRIMYVATSEAQLAPILKKPLIGSNQTQDIRNMKKNNIYVYDIKEDKNYQVLVDSQSPSDKTKTVFFHPNSKNIIYRDDGSITVADFDGLNAQKLYSGPFSKDFLAVSNDGKLIVLTSLNASQNAAEDLYAIGIR